MAPLGVAPLCSYPLPLSNLSHPLPHSLTAYVHDPPSLFLTSVYVHNPVPVGGGECLLEVHLLLPRLLRPPPRLVGRDLVNLIISRDVLCSVFQPGRRGYNFKTIYDYREILNTTKKFKISPSQGVIFIKVFFCSSHYSFKFLKI